MSVFLYFVQSNFIHSLSRVKIKTKEEEKKVIKESHYCTLASVKNITTQYVSEFFGISFKTSTDNTYLLTNLPHDTTTLEGLDRLLEIYFI